jgi:hypothetical protein
MTLFGVHLMSLRQFNVAYFHNEDRIIFRFNTVDQSEYKFWLTRRIVHFILMSTGKFIEKEYVKNVPSVEHVISEVQQTDKQGPSFTKSYEPGFKYPLGVDAILVMDAKCEMMKIEEQDVFSLDFLLPGGGNINLKLPEPIMKSLILLLEEQNIQAKWGNPISTFQ